MADEADMGNIQAQQMTDECIALAKNSAPGSRIKSSDGCCVVCGEKIPEKRLKALPGTGLCVDCAEEFEQEDKKYQ